MIIERKTGFSGIAPITIYDKKGREFYSKKRSTNPDGRVYFNLPAGVYITNNALRKLRRPITYVCPPLPKIEYKRPLPKLQVIVEPNPRKCTVFFETGIIKLDPEYANKPLPNLLHILFHELGHFQYVTEWKCDVFSCFLMLKFGMNPSQCLKKMVHNLGATRETLERVEKNHNFLKRVKMIF